MMYHQYERMKYRVSNEHKGYSKTLLPMMEIHYLRLVNLF